MDDFRVLYQKLIELDLDEQLPGDSQRERVLLNTDELRYLVGEASILSLSDDEKDKRLAYEIVTRLIEVYGAEQESLLGVADVVLSRLGNFPGRQLLRDKYYSGKAPVVEGKLTFERIAREAENSIVYQEGFAALTDFQFKLYNALSEEASLSISAPTSAGKSFVLGLDIERRLKVKIEKEVVVYIVPTRALISEVSLRIRNSLRNAGLANVIVRTTPFVITDEAAVDGAVYVLTQERLVSLLMNSEFNLSITTLIVDEAHEIQSKKRGVILQNAINLVIRRFEKVKVLFASPLISNPSCFLAAFGRSKNGRFFTEETSPVAQNFILVRQVHGDTKKVSINLLNGEQIIDLGVRKLDFTYRGRIVRQARFAKSITRDQDSTILFANGPDKAEKLAMALARELPDLVVPELDDLKEFLLTDVHHNYPLINCLSKGVVFHYGHMPTVVRNTVEELFKAGIVKYICCTSTLLQGINLPARNIVIENPMSGNDPMKRSDFLNLAGRAGRLLEEFHGNIWCLNPDDWNEAVYEGDRLQEIIPAMDSLMNDGGVELSNYMAEPLQNKRSEEFDTAISALYSDIKYSGAEVFIEKYANDLNAEQLEATISRIEEINVELPTELIDAHRSIHPDLMQKMLSYIQGNFSGELATTWNPFQAGFKSFLDDLIILFNSIFKADFHPNYVKWLSLLAYWWMRGESLHFILKNRIKTVSPENQSKLSSAIRECIKSLEHDVRFKLVKYFSAFIDLLKYSYEQAGRSDEVDKIEPVHVYLEYGSCQYKELNLMSLGLSRHAAIYLGSYLDHERSEEPEAYLASLDALNLQLINTPKIVKEEVKKLLGKV